MGGRATLFEVGVLRADSGNEAQPAADGMAPADIEDVAVNVATSVFRELKALKTVNCSKLIAPGNQMGIAPLKCNLVAVDQTYTLRNGALGGIIEMSVAVSARDGNRGARIDRLNHIEKRGVREAGDVSDRPQLTAANEAGQSTTLRSDAHGTARETQARGATIRADEKGTVGQIAEGVADRDLAGSPPGHALQADGLHLLRGIRTAVECSAAEVLEKEITLQPELLQVE